MDEPFLQSRDLGEHRGERKLPGPQERGDAGVGGDGRAEDDGAPGGEAREAGGDAGGVAEVVEVVVDRGDQDGAAVDADAQAQAARQFVRGQGRGQARVLPGRRRPGSENEATTPSPTVLTGAPPCSRRQRGEQLELLVDGAEGPRVAQAPGRERRRRRAR